MKVRWAEIVGMKWSKKRILGGILMLTSPLIGWFFRWAGAGIWNSSLMAMAYAIAGIGFVMLDNLEMM